MPTYDYECKNCGHNLEIVQSMKDDSISTCPKCHKETLFRVVTGGLGFFTANRTVGVIADKQTDKFSEDFKQHLTNKNKTRQGPRKVKLRSGKEVDVQPPEAPPKEKPWYKKNQTVKDKVLRKANPKQLKNYIEKGKLDG